MNKQEIISKASLFVETGEGNRIKESATILQTGDGKKIFGAPIFGFGAASDEYFSRLKDSSVIGKHYMLPQEWLPGAKTVISLFLPFTDEVKKANQQDNTWPSEEWLYGRIEGQAFIIELCRYLSLELIKAGYTCLVPSMDERFSAQGLFTSNWSERHAAFICGLGTFGLSKGLITPKGIAGRFGSLITDLELTPDERAYQDIYEYCSNCGACIERCPVNAISLENGKNHQPCLDFLDTTKVKYKPRYGCGKCQVGVPCESGIPNG